jgi:rhodanese-related sulfurtransferase
MKEFQGTIVDVRTVVEFSGGHVVDSVNIPLQEIMQRIDEVKALKEPLIFCCAAGIRSEQATQYFKSLGIQCENGGGWMDVEQFINNL